MAGEESEDSQSRGRRSPQFDLETAVGFLKRISESLGDGPFARAALAEALGHKAVSGIVNSKVGSLTHFGLLDRGRNSYRLSPLGQRILYPRDDSDRVSALAEAARSPALYRDLCQKFFGKGLPSKLEGSLIHDFGVQSKTAPDVAACFRRSVEYARLLQHGVLSEVPTTTGSSEGSGRESEPHPNGQHAWSNSGQTGDQTPQSGQESEAFSIPLSRGRAAILRISRPISESDFSRIRGWLDLMKDVLTDEEEGKT